MASLIVMVAVGAVSVIVLFAQWNFLRAYRRIPWQRLRDLPDRFDSLAEAMTALNLPTHNPWTKGLFKCLSACKERGFSCDVFVDVGANRGDTTAEFRRLFPSATGYVIEPQPHLRVVLESVAEQEKVAFLPVAAASRDGELTLRYSLEDHFRGGTCAIRGDQQAQQFFDQEALVQARSLDSLAAEGLIRPPQLLKLDVEGMELAVLEGAERILPTVNLVILETTLFPSLMHHPSFAEVVAFMAARGLVLYDIADAGYRNHDGALMILDAVFVRHDSPLRTFPYW